MIKFFYGVDIEMTLKLKRIPKEEIRNYFVCCQCDKLVHFTDISHTAAWHDDPNGIMAYCRACEQIKRDKQNKNECEKRLQQIKEVLWDQESDDDLITVDNTLEEMSESSESGETCECDTTESYESSESDESAESKDNKEEIIKCEKKQTMTTKENDKTIMKKLKLEFWISL